METEEESLIKILDGSYVDILEGTQSANDKKFKVNLMLKFENFKLNLKS